MCGSFRGYSVIIHACHRWIGANLPSLDVRLAGPGRSVSIYCNACGVSSPTRVKSRGTLLSYTDGIVTPHCPVMTRSSDPDSTARATSRGCRSLPPRQHWCRRDSKAKLVHELAGFPPSRSAAVGHIPPPLPHRLTLMPACSIPLAQLPYLWWISVHEVLVCPSVCLSLRRHVLDLE